MFLSEKHLYYYTKQIRKKQQKNRLSEYIRKARKINIIV